MKIAILSFFNGKIQRGVENWAVEISNHISKKHQITIYQSGDKISSVLTQKIDIKIDWKKIITTKGLFRKLYLDYFNRKIAEFTLKALEQIPDDTDIIIPVNGGWQSILSKIYCRRNNKKLVIVGHSGIGWDDYLNVILKPHCFVALSDYQKNWAQKVSKSAFIAHIPNGVDTVKFSPAGKKANINMPKPVIMLPTSLYPSKQIDKAIRAVALLKKGSIVILGSGSQTYKHQLLEICENFLPGRFLLTSVSHKNMPLWYRSADVVTFPSLFRESFGLVILESLSCNKPVVVNNDPIRKEIVGNAGVLTNIQDESEYANALKIVLRTDYKNLPRVQAEKFAWEIIIKKYQQLFESL